MADNYGSSQVMKPLEVVCAVIVNSEGKFLACQRASSPETSLAGKWEFPGGKVEPGETQETALKREISEELEVSISNLRVLQMVSHRYPDSNSDFDIHLSPFLCQINNSSTPTAVEHQELRWVDTVEALELDWAEADLPIREQLKKLL